MLHGSIHLNPHQKVLIQAGISGVDTFAIQSAKFFDAYVATTVSSKGTKLIKSLGADQIIDYRTENFEEILSNYDFVYDTLGGQSLKDAFEILKPEGLVVSRSGMPMLDLAKRINFHFIKPFCFKLLAPHSPI